MQAKWRTWLIAAGLAAAVVSVYAQVRHFEFVLFDDYQYLYENVRENSGIGPGLSAGGVKYVFTHTAITFYHPLTMVSHMADVEFFGLGRPGLHHLENALVHAANTVILFLLLRAMTGAVWRGALVAALFGLHPLHVESVAWVAERKDVMSTLFWLLTMWAYLWYTRRPGLDGVGRYAVVVVLFGAGLLFKPMGVTLPFVLLLMDYWPLGRLKGWRSVGPLAIEKAVLLAMSAGISFLTVLGMKGVAIKSAAEFPVATRYGNALVSYAAYLGDMVWPKGLAAFYPYPEHLAVGRVVIAVVVLGVVTAVVLALAGRKPYLVVGWFWFLGTLVPVIGLLQAGAHARADRFTYVPLIGVFIVLAWGSGDVVAWWEGKGKKSAARVTIGAGWLAALVALSVVTWAQIGTWRDSETLFGHAIAVTQKNYLMKFNLGTVYVRAGDVERALPWLEGAAGDRPGWAVAREGLGRAYQAQRRWDDAVRELSAAIKLQPDYFDALNNRGVVYMEMDGPDWDLAEGDYQRAVEAGRVQKLGAKGEVAEGNLMYVRGLRAGAWEELNRLGKTAQASPGDSGAMARMAWVLATAPTREFRDGVRALALAQRARGLTGSREVMSLEAEAAAEAELGDVAARAGDQGEARRRFERAGAGAEEAGALAERLGDATAVGRLRGQLERYRRGLAVREYRVTQ